MMTRCLLKLRLFTLVLATMALLWFVMHKIRSFVLNLSSMTLIITCLVLQFLLNMEQGLPLLPEWLSFTRVNSRARKGVEIGPARLHLRYECLLSFSWKEK